MVSLPIDGYYDINVIFLGKTDVILQKNNMKQRLKGKMYSNLGS